MSNAIQTISLGKLTLWPGNVRKTDAERGIEELAASIASHGLLNPLLVRKDKRGKFAVIAGQRRLLALQMLSQQERIDQSHPVECRMAGEGANAAELSLAENVVRAAMHPADEFEAFRDLIDGGASIAAVAERFGVADSRVEKRLRLGRLSPLILDAYRKGGIGLEEAMAFTLGADHAAQERVFENLPPWQCRPGAIRRALTEGEIAATDPRVKLIGLEAYVAAGGIVRRDLFDDENAGYVQDAALLDRLALARLAEAESAVRAEGWAWTECLLECDYATLSQFSRMHPAQDDLSPEAQAEIEALEAEYDALADAHDDDGDDDAAAARQGEIDERICAIRASFERWPAETLGLAGAIVTIDGDGAIEIRRGLVKREHQAAARKAAKAQATTPEAPSERKLPATLVADLTATKTASIGAALMKRPDVALAATVHALAGRVFYDFGAETSLRLSAREAGLDAHLNDADGCKPMAALEAARTRWTARLPREGADLWSWCLEQKRQTLLDLLAFIAALTLDAVNDKAGQRSADQLAHADALASALDLDLAASYRPTASGYFTRIGKPAILAAIEEATGKKPAPAWQGYKRDELAKHAEKLIAPTRWLPAPLREAAK